MRTSTSFIAALCTAQLFLAPAVRAETPPAPTPPTPSSAAPAAPAAPAPPAPAAATPAVDAGNFTIPPGWRLRKVKGEMVYCKQEVVLGSRFPKLICMDLDRLKAYEANNRENRDRMGQTNRVCVGTDCGGN